MESIHLRCPHCHKLYSVARSEIRSERPEFHCDACHAKFAMPFPQASERIEYETVLIAKGTGLSEPPQWTSLEEKYGTFSCPFCQATCKKGAAECGSCGRVFEKAKRTQIEPKRDLIGSESLRSLWNQVMAEYANEARHESFVQQALTEKSLPFASQQYRQILEANPSDPIAMKMRERLINLATMTYVPPHRSFQTRARRISFPIVLILVGVLLMATGVLFTPMRSIISVGAVIATLGAGFMAISRRSFD